MSNRRLDPGPGTAPEERSFRLRHVMLLVCAGALTAWLYPRGEAAFELHDRATMAADYGACMAGPMGPSALRDNPGQFTSLVRRRLLIAQSTDRPYADCAPLARALSASLEAISAHGATAADFVEYGAPPPAKPVSLEQLRLSLSGLARLAQQAWPFERRGYAHLMRPSSHRKEAAHPVELNPPAVGSGLPGWRALYTSAWPDPKGWFLARGHSSKLAVYHSTDGGVNWRETTLNQPGVAQHAGRCMAANAQQSFVVEHAQTALHVHSMFLDHKVSSTRLSGTHQVLTLACDAKAMFLAAENDGARNLFACVHGGRCANVPHQPEWLSGHFDLARLDGTSVVATIRGGVVRVRSSRDDGRTWTPATVAFDWGSYPITTDVRVPSRLLALGNQLWLYGAGKPGQSYPVLVSVDMGASWHAPGRGAPAFDDARAAR